ncbi:MAG: SGNH/GDSL hydrolase family protein, partial [Clostridia bacterium]|nr:SGNH/GDSL hydrolase family protein [Clostridia bacterium]
EENEEEKPVLSYSIARNLTNVTGFDNSTTIAEGSELLECYVSNDEYTMNGAIATVTMGGVDITETAYDNGVVNIKSVTGDVVITLDAARITYVIPPVEDFTVQVFEGSLLIKEYTGAEKAIEIPTELTYNGTTYTADSNKLKLYAFKPGSTVEHIKVPSMPYYSSKFNIGGATNLRTMVGDGVDWIIAKGLSNFEKLTDRDISDKTTAITTSDSSTFNGAGIRTLQGLKYPSMQTDLDWLYVNCKSLIDGGVVPSHVTNIDKMFFGCTNLRRVRVEGTEFTNTSSAFYGVNELELTLNIDSNLFDDFRYNANLKWTFKDIGGNDIKRIMCFGDSLSERTYEEALLGDCSRNIMVNSLGNGGYTSEQIYQKMLTDPYARKLSDSIIVIWHGTNGYGVDGYDGVTAKMVSALDGNQDYLLIPPTAQGAGDDVYESWVATYGAEHVLSMGDWFENNGYTVADYLTDGTHFTAEGYALVAKAIYEKLMASGLIS